MMDNQGLHDVFLHEQVANASCIALWLALALMGWNVNGAWASSRTTMQILPTGVGPVNAQTKVTLLSLKALLPNRRIVQEKTVSEGFETAEDFKVFDGNMLMMEVIT